MKIKVISRDAKDHTRTRPQELDKVSKNPNPTLHPHERGREYSRALVAVKTRRMFAKPFIRAMSGHVDSVYSLCKHPKRLSLFVSGSGNGEIRMWNVTTGECIHHIPRAHSGFVRGLAVNSSGNILSAGDDGTVRLWDVKAENWIPEFIEYEENGSDEEYDEELDIMRDPDEMNEDDIVETGFGSSRRKNSEKKIKKTEKQLEEEASYSSRRTGASLYSAHTILKNKGRPAASWLANAPFSSISHKWSAKELGADNESGYLQSCSVFATTSSESVQIWDYERAEPLMTMSWPNSPDSYLTCSYNPIEHDLLVASAIDRSVAVFDTRGKTPVHRIVMGMRSNAISWNPIEAMNFTIANEDHNLYTYDLRNMSSALTVHLGHVAAVLDVDYSPTGREFVSGSYDRTIRIFSTSDSTSRDVYNAARMQRVFCVRYTGDSNYIVSGSDDTNLRLWKSDASAVLGTMTPRQRQKINYQNQLIKRYQFMPEIHAINKRRKVNSAVKSITRAKRVIHGSAQRKLANRMAHSTPGTIQPVPLRRKNIVTEED